MATSYAKHGFNDLAYARLRDNIASGDVTLRMGSWYIYQFNKGWASDRNMYITITDAACNIEVCKVTAITGSVMTIERGQDGTVARAWPVGALISQRLVAANLGRFDQKGEFRTISYNPNGILSRDYPNEKVYETGSHACQKRWWIHAADNKWRLLAGDVCDWEYYDDGWIRPFQNVFTFGSYNNTGWFDPIANTFKETTDLPVHKYMAAAAAPSPESLNGINVFGGGTWPLNNSTKDNYLWQTNLAYAVKTEMLHPPRSDVVAISSYGNYSYCLGGGDYGGSGDIPGNDQYFQEEDSWATKQSVPGAARSGAAGGRPKLGEIYYAGGYAGGELQDAHDEYNEGEDSWTEKTPLPTAVRDCCGACDLDYFYVSFGNGYTTAINYYYPAGNSWIGGTAYPDWGWDGVRGSGCDSMSATYHMGGHHEWTANDNREYFFGWSLRAPTLNGAWYHTVAQGTGFG